MPTATLTKSHKNRSTDTGFQFEFFCDRSHGTKMPNWLTYYFPEPCSFSYTTTLQPYPVGVANKVKEAASWLANKWPQIGKAGDALDNLNKEMYDSAFSTAIAEAKQQFRQCAGCNRWVCKKYCFDETAWRCKDCCVQMRTKKPDTNGSLVTCIHCGEKGEDGNFCAGCGKRMFQKVFCGKCGNALEKGRLFKFCPDCGDSLEYFDDL